MPENIDKEQERTRYINIEHMMLRIEYFMGAYNNAEDMNIEDKELKLYPLILLKLIYDKLDKLNE